MMFESNLNRELSVKINCQKEAMEPINQSVCRQHSNSICVKRSAADHKTNCS